MLKKISVTELKEGMYINDLKCGWLNHPFALNRFKLEKASDLAKIISAGVKSIEIDTNKGLDVFVEKREPRNSQLREAIDQRVNNKPTKVTALEELGKAKVAFAQAGEFISEMMANVKMGQHIELEQVNPVINKLSQSILRNPNALLGLSRIRSMDIYTFEHSVSFSILMMAFAKSMRLSDKIIHEVGIGGLLHDIGKTLTPDEILNNPGKLTLEEFVIMKEHVVHSRKILQKTKGTSQISMDIAAQHHEKFDGNGYPLGLKGDQISRYGQMSAIVDVYDALTADRCYHVGKEPSEVLKLLVKWGGAHFNPSLVREFIQSVGIYPPDSLVMLSNQHLAKVIDINENMLKPIVEVFLNVKTRSYIPRKLLDLSKFEAIKILKVESYAKWNVEA
ncbi:HD-GYP domain-containing protein [Psychromonas sp. Urea-02u-13]|uniref:HD-GYP domain-containing protein n=1 Tax=Psychromonas sp. Urea-02u-13 TaxID=2058326 RepID=UPI000C345BE0|nr:HD-GYP domain-containing protein [Psychromonas sp. Urea-02u-13]PKG39956.1 phosphodiesterase [Psychromonas sp. Urea-02u-13]